MQQVPVPASPRVIILETGGGAPSTSAYAGEVNVTLSIGREAAVELGVRPLDRRVSREAVEVTPTTDGWLVRCINRNGVLVHPWGLPSWMAQPRELLTAPRVALRVLGTSKLHHWIMLEDDGLGERSAEGRGSVLTDSELPVRPLTRAQVDVVRALFRELLAWPPMVPSEPKQLKQVAREIGISLSGVQARLSEVRAKAESLGLSRRVPLADPEYLYVLVRAGYLRPDLDIGLP